MPIKSNFTIRSIYWMAFSSILLLAFSCGLKYTHTETPQTFEQKRHTAVENYILKELNNNSVQYLSVAFGETEVVKPVSYQILDSLYEIKYTNEQNSRFDKELEVKIENQRMIVLNDTNQVIYIEDHLFSLGEGDTLEFFTGMFKMKKDLIIDEVIINESVFIPKSYKELYLVYIFEESILNSGYMASSEELNFYNLFKQPLINMSKIEKDAFILHTLKVMEVAKQRNSINTNTLLKGLASNHFHGKSYINFNDKFSDILVESESNGQKENNVVAYRFTYTYKTKGENNELQTYSYSMEYDPYLRLKKVSKL